jgi:hypothetical protein
MPAGATAQESKPAPDGRASDRTDEKLLTLARALARAEARRLWHLR